jgi:Mg-chelatase subunit ChlD
MLFSSVTGLALGALTAIASAAPPQPVAVSQPNPGDVTVTVRASGAAPSADAFTLQLLNANAAPTRIAAQSVEAANELSPDLATAVLICVDRSGSMQSALTPIKTALKDVLAQPRPDLRIALMSFGSDTPEPTLFYSESASVVAAVDALRAETGHEGKSRLYDALNIGMSRLANAPLQGKRLIVITDGKDVGSQTRFDVLSVLIQERGQPLDAIAFGQAARKSSAGLATLTSKSGGSFVLATSPSSLVDALREDLGTAPAPAYDVKFHYDAAPGAPPLQSAQLVYAPGAGAPSVLMPIRAALAAPAPPQAQPSPASVVGSSAQAGLVSAPQTVAASEPGNPASPALVGAPQAEPERPASSTSRSFITIGTVKIDVKIGFSVLVGLAMVLSAIAYGLHRARKGVVIVVPPPPEPKPQRQGTRVGSMFPPPSPGHPAALLVNEGPRRAAITYAIEKPDVRIGADEANDLVVHDDYASRKHANIRFVGGTLYLTDLGSSNGTFLNDARVSRVMTLNPGDKIRIGRSTWEVMRTDDARSQPRSPGERFERPVP